MNRLLGTLAGALLIAALAACSGGPVVYGGIQTVSMDGKTVRLFNQSTYLFDPGIDTSKYKVGDQVRIAYNVDSTSRPPKNVGSSIAPYGQ